MMFPWIVTNWRTQLGQNSEKMYRGSKMASSSFKMIFFSNLFPPGNNPVKIILPNEKSKVPSSRKERKLECAVNHRAHFPTFNAFTMSSGWKSKKASVRYQCVWTSPWLLLLCPVGKNSKVDLLTRTRWPTLDIGPSQLQLMWSSGKIERK